LACHARSCAEWSGAYRRVFSKLPLVRRRTIGFVVGNGLSRLSGAPAWGDLFNSRDVVEVLKREGVSKDMPYLELGFLLAKRAPVLWDRVLRLYDWVRRQLSMRATLIALCWSYFTLASRSRLTCPS